MKTRSILLTLCAAVCVLALTGTAGAVLTSDSTNIGKHPNYASSTSAFWRTNDDYTVLSSDTYTFLNAPSSSGSIMFRRANSCNSNSGGVNLCVTDPTSASSMAFLDAYSNFTIGGSFEGNSLVLSDTSGASSHIDMTGTAATLYINGSSAVISLNGTGAQASKPGGGSWAATSDIRVKKNEVVYTSGLSKLRRVHPVVYSYNGLGGTSESDQRYVGVNAQDIERVEPSMVSSRDIGGMTGVRQVDPSEFTYMLINAVQELDREVQALRSSCSTPR